MTHAHKFTADFLLHVSKTPAPVCINGLHVQNTETREILVQKTAPVMVTSSVPVAIRSHYRQLEKIKILKKTPSPFFVLLLSIILIFWKTACLFVCSFFHRVTDEEREGDGQRERQTCTEAVLKRTQEQMAEEKGTSTLEDVTGTHPSGRDMEGGEVEGGITRKLVEEMVPFLRDPRAEIR